MQKIQDNIFDFLKKLVAIPSYRGDEQNIAHFISSLAKERVPGHNVCVQEYSRKGRNVFVFSKTPLVLIDAHLDTIPPGNLSYWKYPPLSLTEKGHGFFGLGCVDNKAGISICLALMNEMDCSDVSFSFCGGEEIDARGLRYAISKGILKQNIPLAIVMEPTQLRICRAHKGAAMAKIKFSGVSAHAAVSDAGDNAIEKAVEYIIRLKKVFPQFKKKDSLLGESSYSVNIIRGGAVANCVPDNCEIIIDFRYLPGQDANDIKNVLIRAAAGKENDIRIELKNVVPPMRFQGPQKILDVLVDSSGSSEAGMSYWAHSGLLATQGISSVVFGPGDITHAHKPNEWVEKKDVLEAYESLKRIIIGLRKKAPYSLP